MRHFLTIMVSFLLLSTGCALLSEEDQAYWSSRDSYEETPQRRREPSATSSAPWQEQARAYREAPYRDQIYRSQSYGTNVQLGMDMNSVRSSWGSPTEVHTAGAPHSGNQKWIYNTGLNSYGMAPQRIIYFERGQVVGWDTLK